MEAGETYIGGKAKGKGRGFVGNKGRRRGRDPARLHVELIPGLKRATPHDFIQRNVKDDAEAIYTDELKAYLGIEDHDTRHETVNRAAGKWVMGDVHTNGIEGVWSAFERSIIGSFHKMSAKHMDRHLEELEWRFNNRDNPHIFRDTLARIVKTDPLTYRELIGKAG